MWLQDEHGVPHGTVPLPNLLGEQEEDFQVAVRRAFRPGDSGPVCAGAGQGNCSQSTRSAGIAFHVLSGGRRTDSRAAGDTQVHPERGGCGSRRCWRRSGTATVSGADREGSGKARLMILAAAVLVAAGTLIFTLVVRGRDIPEAPPVSPTAHLEERKAQIYENLRDLQFEFRVGKLSDEDYQKTKLDLQRELAKVLAEIDALQPMKAKVA